MGTGGDRMTELLIAIIGAVGSVIGVVLTNKSANDKMMQTMNTQQAVTDTKLEELTREVREHNDFARRVPVVEEQIKVINHRISDLESYHKGA
jgi:hypothetical protein